MYSNIIGMQQIMITAGFLGLMIVVLVILRKKSTVIRASIKAGKRINVVEDTAVSPTERLRLITVDSNEFIMVSTKGHPPSLVSLVKAEIINDPKVTLCSESTIQQEETKNIVDYAIQEHPEINSLEKNQSSLASRRLGASPIDEQQKAFSEKFKSWRRQNDAR